MKASNSSTIPGFGLVLRLSLSGLALGLLVACGGGGGGGGGAGLADGGIRGTGISIGPVSGFGSVFVNGIRFETDGRVVSDDGIAMESELDEGMILRIEGQWQTSGQGTAERVEYDDTFRGEVAGLTFVADPDTSDQRESVTFTIYGQTITADQQTVFKGVSLQTLADAVFVRVSAWRLADGSYRASYIGLIDATTDNVEIEGRIESDADVSLNRFRLNGFPVSYSDGPGAFEDGLSEGDLRAGVGIEVEGRLDDLDGEPGLIANAIGRDESRRYNRSDDDAIEFSGPVADAYNSATRQFSMNGLEVLVTDDTELDDGLQVTDLQPGTLVQVEGAFIGANLVEAEEIELREANAEVQGVVDSASINFSQSTFRVGGVLVQVTPRTVITDDDSDQRLELNDLNGNYELEVEGVDRFAEGDPGVLEAIKIERDDADDDANEFELTARLRGLTANTLSVLGVTMDIDADETEFEPGRNFFESELTANPRRFPLVEVEYEQIGSRFIAEEIELEEDELADD